MRIKRMTCQGFRGFNDPRVIEFDDALTVIYGPNSYGKTSMSEGLEWLLYGVTSKLESADSKEEYRGSLRNRHFPPGATAFVEAVFVGEGGEEMTLRGELAENDAIKRVVNGHQVDEWPVHCDISSAPRPFILQHALKSLLLAKPIERFERFAGLLGLDELQAFRKNVVSLCTKPSIPSDVDQVRTEVSALKARCDSLPSLKAVARSFASSTGGLSEMYEAINLEASERVAAGTDPQLVLPELGRTRGEAVAKVFEGSVALKVMSEDEEEANAADEAALVKCTADSFVESYCKLVALETIQHLLQRAQFFELGVELLPLTPAECPFCGQAIDGPVTDHIHAEHEELLRQRDDSAALLALRAQVGSQLDDLVKRLDAYHLRNADKAAALLAVEAHLEKLESILLPGHPADFDAIQDSLVELGGARSRIDRLRGSVSQAVADVQSSVGKCAVDAKLVKVLGERLLEYVAETRSYREAISARAPVMSDAQEILDRELDALVGTEDISVLIDLIEARRKVEKALRVEDILSSLRQLRVAVDQFVAREVVDRISEVGTEVMEWYGRIKTTGDPDVHFSGFGVPTTAQGQYKSGRIDIKATSYGADLVSAVSCLSESKLNALGLCLCIATNTQGHSPLEFLIIDDPIQSWDDEHETQFIEVVRALVSQGTQVVIMSHKLNWLHQLRLGCREFNGRFWEITGYTRSGPRFGEVPWATWQHRLQEVDAILRNHSASVVRVQQAEEEIRIAVGQITSELYLKVKRATKSPHDLNGAKARKMLVECGVDSGLVDRVCQTFGTTDDAHHAPRQYEPNRQRIRQYHSYCWELAKLLGDP